jgi:protein O-GlcNAc transferase
MFSEIKVHPKLCLCGYGVLILLVLVGGMTGCSSRAPETDKLYSSEEGVPETAMDKDKMASLPPGETSSAPAVAVPDTVKAIPIASYPPADREVVLRYAEKGEHDSANLDQALKLVQRAEQLSSAERTMEDYLVLAIHYRLKGDKDQLVQQANQGIMAKSDSKRVKANMFVYLGYTYEIKSPTMARSYFSQAAQIDPDFYRGHFESGRILFQDKKHSEAEAPLKKALSLNPENADVYGLLGQMFYGMDRYEEAIVSLEKALAMSPQTHWIHLKLADTYFYGMKKREEGGRHYQQAVLKGDSDPEAHFGVALYYRYRSEYKKADTHLQKAMVLDHKNPRYKRELADMNSEKSEIKKGIRKHEKAIEETPKDPSPVSKLGRYYLRWGKYDKAEEQYKKAVQLASVVPKAPEVKPDPDADSDEPVKPQEMEPSKVPEHASNLGWFYFNDKKYAQATRAFKRALKIDPKYVEAQFGLGRTYEELKEYDKAVVHYAKTVEVDPKHEEAQEQLTGLKQSGKLTPVAEVVEMQNEKTIKKSLMKVRK